MRVKDALYNRFGKPDIERLGLFMEMPYVREPIKKKPGRKTESLVPYLVSGRKTIAGNQDGFFDKLFRRIFEKEAWAEPPNTYVRPSSLKKGINIPWMPTGEAKKHSTPGDNFGTFYTPLRPFKSKKKKGEKRSKDVQLRNFFSRPLKLGGPGYVDITISKYPTHSIDPYGLKKKWKTYPNISENPMYTAHYTQAYFDHNPFRDLPGKRLSRYKIPKMREVYSQFGTFYLSTRHQQLDGCFSKYPERKGLNKYVDPVGMFRQYTKTKKDGLPDFYPHSWATKAFSTFSIVNLGTDIHVNAKNFRSYEPNYIKYLL